MLKDLIKDALMQPALRMLDTLSREGAMNMRSFSYHSHVRLTRAQELREWMVKQGWITVTKTPVKLARVTTDIEIRLTKKGEAYWRHLKAGDSILEGAKKKPRGAKRKRASGSR